MSSTPAIQTTTVGSYPVPEWLQALPSEQGVIDATRVVFDTQRQAGVDFVHADDGGILLPAREATGVLVEFREGD